MHFRRLDDGRPDRDRVLDRLLLVGQAEAAVDGILTVNAEGTVVVLNRALREMWSLPEEAAPGCRAGVVLEHIAARLQAPTPFVAGMERMAAHPLTELEEQLALPDAREVRWTSRPVPGDDGKYLGRVDYYSDVTRLVYAEREAIAKEARTRGVIDGALDAIVSLDDDLRVIDFNRSAELTFGWAGEDALWRPFEELAVEAPSRGAFAQWLRTVRPDGSPASSRVEFPMVRASGKSFIAECTKARREGSTWMPITVFVRDVSLAKRLEADLRQAQKLESVGRLASGIAHEINTPIQYIGDSLFFVRDSFTDLLDALRRARAAPAGSPSGDGAGPADDDADLDDLMTDVPKAIDRAIAGLERVAALVRGMKEFAQPDIKQKSFCDLNRALQTTLTVAHHEYASVVDVETDLAELPLVPCVLGEINQVFLSVLVNAAQAVADVVRGTGQRGQIRIRTWHEEASVFVSISDTGAGIPDAIRDKVFEPFFTTRPVGQGTGQGLATARSVVVDRHDGDITFETRIGQGTTFTIRLPIRSGSDAGSSR